MADDLEILKLIEQAATEGWTGLNLSNIQLSSLPPQIGTLTNLAILDLSNNQLSSLPPEIAKLTELTNLDLNNNQLTCFPPEITNLTNLIFLDLRDNQLTSLPPETTKLTNLVSISLQANQLANVPAEITKLTRLRFLNLKDNPLPIPPETLANPSDIKAIFGALDGLMSGERLNEAKMLVVGDAKVGKSSLVDRLMYDIYNPEKLTTRGVAITDEMRVVQSEVTGEGEPVRLNIWDFGGQEIHHSTHQFFLTTRSLYLLVVDARKGDQLSNIEYWLKLIKSFGGASPVIIVINQIDQLRGGRPLNLDRKALQEKYNIRGFIETSCETGQGIRSLKVAIAREVEHLQHVRDIWPREWLAIKKRLKEMSADYIPVEKYLEICAEENLNDEELQQSLLDILHVLGTVIRFPGDTQVLNPRWVTQGVYGMLTSQQLVMNQGEFDLKDVGRILAELPGVKEHYPPHTHSRLINVMQHFELCFEFTDRPGHYLIPRYLSENELDIPWDDAGAMNFQYHYETLPDSVISRFIVRMSHYIAKPHYWKSGVFLETGDGDRNLAKVKADPIDRKIFISIIGREETRRAFLAVIRSAFDEINSNFNIEIRQMIPVPSSEQVLVNYNELLVLEEIGETDILIPQLRRKFSVKQLLDGVEELSTRLERRIDDLTQKTLLQKVVKEVQPTTHPGTLRIVVASPSDVQPERDVVPAVIEEVNRYIASDRGLNLVLTRWETDAHPGFHPEGPQGVIDPKLKIADCDLLIGIFWKRFGTPTADGRTGTEHEFNLAYQSWQEKGSPQIFVYFNQKPYTLKSKEEAEQLGRVLEFRDTFPKEGLFWHYEGEVQFERLVRDHLMDHVRSLPEINAPESHRKKLTESVWVDGVKELRPRQENRERDLKESRFPARLSKKVPSKPQLRILRVVVASPGDVQTERDVLPSLVDEINQSVGTDRGLHLVLSRWQTDAHPGFHTEGAQGLIDPILKITDCDLLIGIFWKRFGTPADGQTGTEHELGLAYEAWQETGRPQIFVYFNQKPYAATSTEEAEQWRKVHEFRDGLPKEGLWWPYKGTAQFEKLVRNHLVNYIRNLD